MSELTTAARPYARAVFELAQESNSFERWSDLLQNLAAIAGHADMAIRLDSPSFSRSEKANMLVAVLGDENTNAQERNFVSMLAENARLPALVEIAAHYEVLRAEAEGIVEATVVSAVEIDETQKQKITEALKKRFGCDVSLSCSVDESLMGGAIIRAGDVVIDGSIKSKVEKLSHVVAR